MEEFALLHRLIYFWCQRLKPARSFGPYLLVRWPTHGSSSTAPFWQQGDTKDRFAAFRLRLAHLPAYQEQAKNPERCPAP